MKLRILTGWTAFTAWGLWSWFSDSLPFDGSISSNKALPLGFRKAALGGSADA